jgi:hypothetical protein
LAPGTHCVQAPATHEVAHAGPLFPNLPLVSQRIGWLPAQLRAPGLQSEHTPSITHAVHGTVSSHAPPVLHVCDMFPLHRLVPGLHTPVHRPPEQMLAQAAPADVQRPLASQT